MVNELKDLSLQKNLLWLNGFLPIVFLLNDFYKDNLGANPPEAVIRTTGIIAIIFLALSLLATPFAKVLKLTWILKHRRWLGLWCFYYACLHLVSYAIFDKGLNLISIIEDIGKRPFILLGFLGFAVLIPLAITSSNSMIKRLGGANWKKLHKLTHLVPPLVVIHFWMIVKSDIFYPALFALVFSALLLYRLRSSIESRFAKNKA